MRVFRIETPDGIGPYQLGSRFNREPQRDGHERRPLPWMDGLGGPKVASHSPWRFGYPSLEKAREWWIGDERFISELARCGVCRLVIYEAPDDNVIASKSGRQVMFLREDATKVEECDLSCLCSCVDAVPEVSIADNCAAADTGPWPRQIDGLWVGDAEIPF